jgi:hypothetical protein
MGKSDTLTFCEQSLPLRPVAELALRTVASRFSQQPSLSLQDGKELKIDKWTTRDGEFEVRELAKAHTELAGRLS